MKFYICRHCGNIVMMVQDKGVPMHCCGQEMKELVAGTTDGAREKHVPVYSVENGVVHAAVGSVAHPMQEVHHIPFIALETRQGGQIKYLKPGEEPKADFALTEGDEVTAVYEYCNLHGLWKA